jgi:DNA helicase-2/ATP-dependent DNA helicase PcrA
MQDRLAKITNGLNERQREAVTTINGPLLVVAGAGSGKTKVLTHRIAYMIESGITPWNILSLTFTNKAAAEMKQRISTLLTEAEANQVYSGTFHSVFGKILRTEAHVIGYTSNYSIYDTDDQDRVVKKIIKDLGFGTNKGAHKPFMHRISAAKNELLTAADYKAEADTVVKKETAMVYEAYEKFLKENDAMDFDDLLINFIVLLQKDQSILEKYQNRFRFVLVDEYQDTNKAQYIAIRLLTKAHSNICVVGDDAQSIYKWRGADIRNILDFQKDNPAAKIIRLEQNYRSTKNILGGANSVIAHNKEQIPKKLFTENPQGEKINILKFENDNQEAFNIAATIKTKGGYQYTWKDFAVLYRTNAQSRSLESAFRKHSLPYQIIGGMSFYKRKEVKDVAAYLRLLVNQSDGIALMRVVNEPPRGLGTTSLDRITNYANRNGEPIVSAFRNAENVPGLQKRAVNAATKFINTIDIFREKYATEDKSLAIEQYIEATGLIEMYQSLGTEEAEDRLNNINELLSDIVTFLANNPEYGLDDYLQTISLSSDFEETDMNKDCVKLMTVHAAKGLEFPYVFVAGMAEGLLPLERNGAVDDLEEERRLMYVAMTRAMEKLYLTYPAQRYNFGDIKSMFSSIFLSEIKPDFVHRNDEDTIRRRRPQPPKFPNSFSQRPKPKPKDRPFFDDIPQEESYSQIPEDDGTPLKVGDRVRHSKFGNGKITGMSGAGNMQKATVNFDAFGKKSLMMQFAKLVKIG